jgi:polysaccharide biosynthesis transport protein
MNSLDRSLHGGLSFRRTLSLANLQSLIWRRKLLVAITSVTIGAAGIVACFLITPVYEVTSIVSGQIGASPQSDATNRAAISAAILEQRLNSLVQILQSEEVVRRAILSEGAATLFPQEASGAAARGRSPEDAAYKAVNRALTVRVEPNTNLLRVAFRHTDPTLAVHFVRELVHEFIDRSLELENDSAAVGFFQRLEAKYDLALELASAAFSTFSSASSAFSIEEQRKLTLERGNSLKAALALTRGSIAERDSQIAALNTELLRIRPRALESKQLGLSNSQTSPADAESYDRQQQPFSSDPPLLMVRVYQESVQTLVRLRSEVAGFRALEEQQGKELAKVEDELKVLAANEAKFERLKRDLELARQRVELYAKKVSEQQLEADLNANRFSSIRVVQAATMPLEPVFPKPHLLIPLALMIGLIAGVGAAVLFEVTEPAKAEPAKVAQYPKFAKSPLLLLFSLALTASRLFF